MTIASKLYTLLSEGISGNQTQLVEILKEQGVTTTQSSVSRALKKINAVKGQDSSGNVIYSLPRVAPVLAQTRFFESLVYQVLDNGHLIVVHTRPGTANTIAKFIDEHDFKDILGSVAGDDTIIIVPADVSKTARTARALEDFLKTIGVF